MSGADVLCLAASAIVVVAIFCVCLVVSVLRGNPPWHDR